MIGDAWQQHKAAMAERNERAQSFRRIYHPNKRRFTDAQMLEVLGQTCVVSDAAKILGTTPQTIRSYMDRLGIRPRDTRRIDWTAEEDAAIRDAKLGLAAVMRQTGRSKNAVKRRAAQLGVAGRFVKVQPPRPQKPTYTVGSSDRLLNMLRRVHGEPRSEVYPGTR